MSRYINAEGFEKLFDEEYKATRKLINEGETHLDNIAEGFLEAARVIRKIPTADVVEVVRCKDCKFFKYGDYCDEGKMEHSRCRENDYCSYGERSENGT